MCTTLNHRIFFFFFREKFCVEFFDGGKWKKHFLVLFSGHIAQLMNFMGLLIFPFDFPVIRGLKKRSCYTHELGRQQARDI